jgi:hypothetical protein
VARSPIHVANRCRDEVLAISERHSRHDRCIDLDRLRHDPLTRVAVGRCPESGAPLASQSTIWRRATTPGKLEVSRRAASALSSLPAEPCRRRKAKLKEHAMRTSHYQNPLNTISTIGVDVGKNTFHLVGLASAV